MKQVYLVTVQIEGMVSQLRNIVFEDESACNKFIDKLKSQSPRKIDICVINGKYH